MDNVEDVNITKCTNRTLGDRGCRFRVCGVYIVVVEKISVKNSDVALMEFK